MAEIFICYRRDDTEAYAGRLHDYLSNHYGERAVFVDVDNLRPGEDFDAVIQRTLLRSKIVIVVIGRRWLDPRLQNSDDYVRREILAALKGRKRIIPVLVGDAKMPRRDKLPADIASLVGKNAVTLHHPTWKNDVARLITSFDRMLGRQKSLAKQTESPRSKPKPKPVKTPREKKVEVARSDGVTTRSGASGGGGPASAKKRISPGKSTGVNKSSKAPASRRKAAAARVKEGAGVIPTAPKPQPRRPRDTNGGAATGTKRLSQNKRSLGKQKPAGGRNTPAKQTSKQRRPPKS